MIPRITAATKAKESVTMIAVKALALTILKPPVPGCLGRPPTCTT